MLVLLALLPLTDAATYTWSAGVDGWWEAAGHWTPAGVPGSGDTVVIGGANTTVRVNGSHAVAALTVTDNATLVLGISECPLGWAPITQGATAAPGDVFDACARAVDARLTWRDAETACATDTYDLAFPRTAVRGGVHAFMS